MYKDKTKAEPRPRPQTYAHYKKFSTDFEFANVLTILIIQVRKNYFTDSEIVEKDCRARGLNTEDAMVRSRWRKQIGMIDDQDECEWVNVSSGTGSPGLSRTDSTEP